ncbi:hypothetical protein ABU614_19780 [Lysobacter firmicutimachus]|uniref:Large polyvalent protein-associated domain-containing protein n=1 Tax=Lysobacter firmicutimachus TaxID=1792846 RepID=A0AAU8MRC5_9GAMM
MIASQPGLNPLGIADYLRQKGVEGEARGKRMRISDLASKAYKAPIGQSRDLVAKMISEDPASGMQFGQQLQETEDARMRRLGSMARTMKRALDTKDPAEINGTWQVVLPELQRDFPGQYSSTWDPAYQPALDQVLAMDEAHFASKAPNDVRSFEYFAQGLSPAERDQARKVQLGVAPRAVTGASRTFELTGRDGRTRIAQFDPTTRAVVVFDEIANQWVPLGGGSASQVGAASPSTETRETNGMRVEFDNPEAIPAHVRAAIEANPDGWGAAPDGTTARIGPQQLAARPGLGTSPSPAEKAYAEQNARNRADLDTYARRAGLEADAAAAKTAAEVAARTQGEAAAKLSQRGRDASDTIALLEEAGRILPSATGSAVGAAIDEALGSFGASTAGANATARLKTIAGQLTGKMPRFEGPQSNLDVQLYKDMAGDLANPRVPIARRLAALEQLRRLSQRAAAGSNMEPNRTNLARPQTAAEFAKLPKGTIYIDPDDGRTYRKP